MVHGVGVEAGPGAGVEELVVHLVTVPPAAVHGLGVGPLVDEEEDHLIREDEEELSPEHAASPGPRSEEEEHAEALKVQEEVLREAAGMGFDVGGLTAEGLCAGDEAMVLALLWQLAHAVLLAPVNVHSCTELESLLLPGEEQSAAPDDLLFRWLNHHLHQGNRQERVVSWTDPNLRSGVAYASVSIARGVAVSRRRAVARASTLSTLARGSRGLERVRTVASSSSLRLREICTRSLRGTCVGGSETSGSRSAPRCFLVCKP